MAIQCWLNASISTCPTFNISNSILGSNDWFSKKPQHWNRVIPFRVICLWWHCAETLYQSLVFKEATTWLPGNIMEGIYLSFSDKLSIDQFLSILSMTINNHKNFSDHYLLIININWLIDIVFDFHQLSSIVEALIFTTGQNSLGLGGWGKVSRVVWAIL